MSVKSYLQKTVQRLAVCQSRVARLAFSRQNFPIVAFFRVKLPEKFGFGLRLKFGLFGLFKHYEVIPLFYINFYKQSNKQIMD